jgi:hypothetical protein
MSKFVAGRGNSGRWWSYRLVRFAEAGVDGGDFFEVCEVYFDGETPTARTDGVNVCGDTVEEANKVRVMLLTAFKYPPIDNTMFEETSRRGEHSGIPKALTADMLSVFGIEYEDDIDSYWVPAEPGPVQCDTLIDALKAWRRIYADQPEQESAAGLPDNASAKMAGELLNADGERDDDSNTTDAMTTETQNTPQPEKQTRSDEEA